MGRDSEQSAIYLRKEKKDMAVNVLEHEPHTALFVPDADPLLFYRAITRLAVQTLSKGGRLYLRLTRYMPTTLAI